MEDNLLLVGVALCHTPTNNRYFSVVTPMLIILGLRWWQRWDLTMYYTGWPIKNGTAYFHHYEDATTGISV